MVIMFVCWFKKVMKLKSWKVNGLLLVVNPGINPGWMDGVCVCTLLKVCGTLVGGVGRWWCREEGRNGRNLVELREYEGVFFFWFGDVEENPSLFR